MTTELHVAQSGTTSGSARRTRLIAVGGGVLAATLIWVVARVLDVDLTVEQGGGKDPMHVNAGFVIGFALVFALLGWAALALFERFTAKPATGWTILSVVVLLLSLGMPLSADTSSGAKTMLALMHVALGAVLIPLMRGSVTKGR
ncbi:DUF6069 family protein [Kitasatospora sp. NPDC059327]|uniref:DUF6069 family protein n=1 Tax=Kitasatospora sp. NPDC059327 TaxID=3346803 RepID=UPI0036C7C403